jgi:hypothetical protein
MNTCLIQDFYILIYTCLIQNFLTVEIPTPKPYIFMIGVTRRIKCLVVHNPGVNPQPLRGPNLLTVEIPTPKPYIFMIGVTRRIKFLVVQNPGVKPHPYLPRTFNGWDPHP